MQYLHPLLRVCRTVSPIRTSLLRFSLVAVLMLALGAASPLVGQDEIGGRVLDAGTNQPIAGAQISIVGTNQGGLTQSFEYKQVGVVLNVRPRITAQNDVNMEIYLELSSIVPGVTLFGGAIIDRSSFLAHGISSTHLMQ